MFSVNPYANLATVIPASLMQYFVIAMVLLIIIGTGLDMLHKKNVIYFFRNAQKAKKSAKNELSTGKRTAVILKTVAHDIATMAEKHAVQLAKSQIEVNKMEAQSGHWFVASWRPFIGWVCGIALAWHFVLAPFVIFFTAMFGVTMPPLPEFDMGSLMTVLMGMLGLGGLRTFEKYKKITK